MGYKITRGQMKSILDQLDGLGGGDLYATISSIYLSMEQSGQKYVYVYGRDAS